jgi:transposase
MQKIYRVDLTEAEQNHLQELVSKGKTAARKITRARILLLAHQGKSDSAIGEALHSGRATVERTRKRFVEEGLEACLKERPRPGKQRKLDGKQEALVVALACSDPPQGRECWTMQLLAERVVELGLVESICDETIRRTLKKTSSSRGKSSNGAFPK